ncbi:YgcG family protein [Myxosarcina sp. GI1]|uniref:TPM domain-containing protein n=1 Tax=Myxosarcina sp. GI1 TaxID=1541065 RepID=UPI00056668D0|nr:TPM domain-containing protein [Myxosarcina sp. GI1]
MKTTIYFSMLKHIVSLGVIGATVTLFSATSQAVTVEEVANPRQTNGGWVTDMADILSSETEDKLNSLITNLERADGTEIAVVTMPETAPAVSPKAFATELFNYWGIGKEGLDNGILFLISEGDNRIEIETGYGIPERMSDEWVATIINNQILPQYRVGDFDGGTLAGTQALIQQLQSDPKFIFNEQNFWLLLLTGTGAIAIVGGITRLIRRRNKIFVKPGKNLSLQRKDTRTVCCAKCRQPMNRTKEIVLTDAQRVAQRLGSVSYRAYHCSHYNLFDNSVVAYFSDSDRYEECSKCQELTVVKTGKVITPATTRSSGELLSIRKCHCCDYYQEKTEIIPAIAKFNPQRDRTHHNNFHSHHHYYSGGDSYSGGGSSGGDFGGGSSGGGGAGGGW